MAKKQKTNKIDIITVYGKKEYQRELKKQQVKYLADMSKYKKDSTQWTKANKAYNDSLNLFNYSNNTINKYRKEFGLEQKASITDKSLKKYSDTNRYPYDYIHMDAKEYKELTPNNIPKSVAYGKNAFNVPIYERPTNKPRLPLKPTETNVEYNTTYENLKMRSLWANKAKQDTTTKIGVLNPLDYNNENKGFNITDARNFPQEVKDKHGLNYIDSDITPAKKFKKGGKFKVINAYNTSKFLQPTSNKLPGATRIPYKNRGSSEVSVSIGGENGEPAYLIPSFKYGKFLKDPVAEYNKTGEHLGGPFKTYQEADDYARNVRHPYVEKNQDIPSPIRTWGKGFRTGGTINVTNNNNDMAKKLKRIKSIKPKVSNTLRPELVDTTNRIYDNKLRYRNNGNTYFEEANRLDSDITRFSNTPGNRAAGKVIEANNAKIDLYNHQVDSTKKKLKTGGTINVTKKRLTHTMPDGTVMSGATHNSGNKNKVTTKNKSKKKTNYLLGGIMQVASAGLSIYNAAEANKTAESAARIQKSMEAKQLKQSDALSLEDYNTSGTATNYYKKGGEFSFNSRTKGNIGKFKPIGDGVLEVKGPSHANGGVKFAGAEVEGEELIKMTPSGIKVLSNSKKDFGFSPAKSAKNSASVGEAFNNNFATQEAIKGTKGVGYKLENGGYIHPEDALTTDEFNNQFNNKSATGSQPYGGKYSMVPSLIDNVTNAITTGMTPKIPAPAMVPLAKFNKDVNVEPLVSNVRAGERATVNYANKNLADANVATAMRTRAGNQSTSAINAIRMDEINKEADLANREQTANLYPNMMNTRAINEFGNTNVQRQLGINSAINENMNNLSRDLIDRQDKRRFDNKDKDRLSIELAKDTEGSLSHVVRDTKAFDELIMDPNFSYHGYAPSLVKELSKKRTLLMSQRNR